MTLRELAWQYKGKLRQIEILLEALIGKPDPEPPKKSATEIGKGF